jgi:hypothetical protein
LFPHSFQIINNILQYFGDAECFLVLKGCADFGGRCWNDSEVRSAAATDEEAEEEEGCRCGLFETSKLGAADLVGERRCWCVELLLDWT